MNTARLTTKGQLVIPKAIRDNLHLKPGTDFAVTTQNGRIVLDPRRHRKHRLAEWQGVNPRGVRLSSRELCAPVTDYDRE